jgi:hypothetical protein
VLYRDSPAVIQDERNSSATGILLEAVAEIEFGKSILNIEHRQVHRSRREDSLPQVLESRII